MERVRLFELEKNQKTSESDHGKSKIQLAFEKIEKQQEIMEEHIVSRGIDSSVPMHMRMQKYYIDRPSRGGLLVGGLEESGVHSELADGANDFVDFDFKDYFSYFPSEETPLSVHNQMELALGIDIHSKL